MEMRAIKSLTLLLSSHYHVSPVRRAKSRGYLISARVFPFMKMTDVHGVKVLLHIPYIITRSRSREEGYYLTRFCR